ncbi:MAG TPA: RNA methyltransferase [Methylomirabilota bacterium]
MKVEIIEDPTDPRIADYRAAREGQLRRHDGLFLAEGRLVIRRLLEASRFRTRSLLSTRRALDDLLDLLSARGAPRVYEVSTETIRAIVGFKFHRGCLALGERGPSTAARELVAPAGPRIVVALDELADPDNVGAVFRNAAAFGAAGVLLSPGCADPLYRKAIRVSMGATLSTPFARAEWADGLAALRGAGYTLVALTPDPGAHTIDAVVARGVPSRRLALIVGAEGAGLSQESRAAADLQVRIPMAPSADSLNVATACGIALHRLAVDVGSGIMSGGCS